MIEDYTVIERNEAETVAVVEGTPDDALPIATVTLGNLQAFVDRLAGIAKPEDEIDLYLDIYTLLGKPASGEGKRMALVQGLIVEDVPDDPAGTLAGESGTRI